MVKSWAVLVCVLILLSCGAVAEDLQKIDLMASKGLSVSVPGKINISLIENTDVCLDCHSTYRICKLGSLTAQESDFKLDFLDKTGLTTAQNYRLEALQFINKTRVVEEHTTTNKTYICDGEVFQEPNYVYCVAGGHSIFKHIGAYAVNGNTISYQEERATGSHTEAYQEHEYIKVTRAQLTDTLYKANNKDCYYVRVSGLLAPRQSKDNIIDLAGKKFIEFAWWNASFSKRYPINCSLMPANMPSVINGTKGFTLPGAPDPQIVWFTCQPGAYIYYNNFSSYAIANDTSILPFNVERGNVSSYAPYTMWNNTGVSAAYLFDAVDAVLNDSAGEDNLLDTLNSPSQQAGFTGGGMGIESTQKAQSQSHLSPALNFEYRNWSILYYSRITSTGTNLFIVQKYTFGTRGYYCGSDGDVDKMYMGIYGSSSLQMAGNRTLQTGGWNQHVCTRENNPGRDWIRVYMNGTIDNTATDTGTHNASEALPFYIQGSSAHAVMDSVLIFNNRLLTSPEIQSNYNNMLAMPGYGRLGQSENISLLPPSQSFFLQNLTTMRENESIQANWSASQSPDNLSIVYNLSLYSDLGVWERVITANNPLLYANFNSSDSIGFKKLGIQPKDSVGNTANVSYSNIFQVCLANFSCSSFGACNALNVTPCVAVSDPCGIVYTGNVSDYDGVCAYAPPSPAPEVANFVNLGTTQGQLFLFILVFFYIALMTLTLIFRNFGIGSLMWFIGVAIGLILLQFGIMWGFAVVLLDSVIFMTIGKMKH